MEKLLKRLGLIDYLAIELKISKLHFIEKLSSIVDEGSTGPFANPFEVFSSSKNEFKGQVTYEGFRIKRRRRFFGTKMDLAVAKGSFVEGNGTLKIETEIDGFNSFFLPFYIILIVVYSIFFFNVGGPDNNDRDFVFPVMILHASIMFGLPYLIVRSSVKGLKYDIEREFYYLTKD